MSLEHHGVEFPMNYVRHNKKIRWIKDGKVMNMNI